MSSEFRWEGKLAAFSRHHIELWYRNYFKRFEFYKSVVLCRDSIPFWREVHYCVFECFSLRLHCEREGSNIRADRRTWQTAFVRWEQADSTSLVTTPPEKCGIVFLFSFFLLGLALLFFLPYCYVHIKDSAELSVFWGKSGRCQTCCPHLYSIFWVNILTTLDLVEKLQVSSILHCWHDIKNICLLQTRWLEDVSKKIPWLIKSEPGIPLLLPYCCMHI